MLRLSIWDLIGVMAYSQMFTLLETVLVFLALVLLAFVLPKAWFRRKFVALSGAFVLLTSVWLAFLHYNDHIIENRQLVRALIWGVSLALLIVASVVLIHRSERFEKTLNLFIERLAVLSFIYLLVDGISVILVIIRNF